MQEYHGGTGIDWQALLALALGISFVVFWMVVGWRAMIAHEQLAGSLKRLASERGQRGDPE